MKNSSFKTVLFLSTLLISTCICSSEPPPGILTLTPTSEPSDSQPVDFVACPELPSLPSIDTEGLPPLSVYLSDYVSEFPDDPPLVLEALIINASEKTYEYATVELQFYDQDGNPLTSMAETCHSLRPGESCNALFFTEVEIPANYAAYNLYAESVAMDGTRYEAQLSDHPLRGDEELLESPIASQVFSHAIWNLPPEGYTHGEALSVNFIVTLTEGEVIDSTLCGKVIEFRKDTSGKLFDVVLAEICQPVTMTQHAETFLEVPFTPSGFSWIAQVSEAGAYTPVGILGCLTLDEIPIESSKIPLYLPPIQILGVWWERNGTPVETYKPGEKLTSYIRITSLVSDETPHSLSLKIMRYDEESRLISWFLPIPIVGGLFCAAGACDDLYLRQDFNIQLVEGETTTYELDVTFPEAGEEYYRILFFDNEPFWGEDERIH